MRLFISMVILMALASTAFADGYTRGYYKQNGTYVNGYNRSTPNSSYNDNYKVKGNTNPYTGQDGTASRTYNDKTPNYNKKTYGDPLYENNSNSYGSKKSRGYGY